MQQLLPEPVTIDPVSAYERGPGPYLRANMVASLDGAAQLDGHVGALTSPADQEVLWTLRAQAQVVLVGSGTIRAEGYGPLRIPEQQIALRAAFGADPGTRLAILSNSGRLDPAGPAFTGTTPLLIVPAAATPTTGLAEAAELIIAGDDELDLAAAVTALRQRGHDRILSEGGPRTLGRLLAADLVDELCLTTTPKTVLGTGSRLAIDDRTLQRDFDLARLLHHDGTLFARWVRRRD
ncbi:dihydrofolate reductase family protein [Naumannella halotolerans]|uniref:Riboflavin biosynthesis pyrimidine reductase n=1 Tax=Naumannella halotolerans TaxID=993414 RepID=A0A4R7J374_9ACTN|nr:dihydrofolate reductase family protein [Naumannella halotolerans]TDT30837.1 riboflavin biosynthesis pyrimidine reductase [Naumannella halotolerans]